jgi:hypothetical protein
MRALSTGPTEQAKPITENMLCAWLEKLLSLITFFAAAKKVIPPPGRRLLNKKPINQQLAQRNPRISRDRKRVRHPIMPKDQTTPSPSREKTKPKLLT